MKILLLQSGPEVEAVLFGSLLIGLHKRYPKCQIIWVGNPAHFELVRFNRRINDFVDINSDLNFKTLTYLHGADLCINPCRDRRARSFVSKAVASSLLGFGKDGPLNRDAIFFERVVTGATKTNKTLLQMYYALAGLSWDGEGYGLSYYPKIKQTRLTGVFSRKHKQLDEGQERIRLPRRLLSKIDTVNKYRSVITDDHLILRIAIALRKNVTFYSSSLPYAVEFFGRGQVVPPPAV